MSAQGAAAAGDAAETTVRTAPVDAANAAEEVEVAQTSSTEQTEDRGQTSEEAGTEQETSRSDADTSGGDDREVHGTLLGDVLGELDLPQEIKDLEKPKPKAAATAKAKPAPKAGEGEAEVPTGAAEDEDHPVREDWPPDALAQVMADRKKRKDRTAERDKAIAGETKATKRAEAAEAKLAELSKRQPVRVTPTPQDPLADVNTIEELDQEEKGLEDLLEWATRNPNGLQDVLLRKNPDGSEIRRDYTAEQMAEIRLDAERKLRKAVPARKAYIQDRSVNDDVARQMYPEVFEEGTPEHNVAHNVVLKALPEILRSSDGMLNLAIFVRGLKAHLRDVMAAKAEANGNGQSPTVAAVQAAKKTPKAPPATTLRSAPARTPAGAGARSDDDVDAAERAAFESGGDEEAVGDLIGELLDSGKKGKGGRAAALV